MVRKLRAVYEGGVLRPVEPLELDEHQLVSVIILDDIVPDEELRFEAPERFEALADHSVSLEAVRRALEKIPGSLDADFAAERNER
jgi:predicted DNA-binding antitoxin AbrB/MazE fold protein